MDRQSPSEQPGPRGAGRILILCNDAVMRYNLVDALTGGGYHITQTTQSAQTLVQLTDEAYDALILNLDSVQSDVVAFMGAARKLQPELQLIILTAHPSLRTAIAAVRIGAADYLVSPIKTNVVIEAVQRSIQAVAMARNRYVRVFSIPEPGSGVGSREPYLNRTNDQAVIVVPPVHLDCGHRRATLLTEPGRTVDLSRGEMVILASLMSTPDQPLRVEQIARTAWKYRLDPIEAGELIRPYIFRLRRKLEAYPEQPAIILTVRGRGYVFASSQGLSA